MIAKKIGWSVFVFFCCIQLAQAAQLTVTTPKDDFDGICDKHCSLRDAITVANLSSKTTRIYLPETRFPYTLTREGMGENKNETGDLDLLGSLALLGEGNGAIIDGNGIDRVLHVHLGAQVTIKNITFQNGDIKEQSLVPHGGGIFNAGSLTLEQVTITGNHAHGDGGGIFNRGKLVLEKCHILRNQARGNGGGIEQDGTSLEIVNSTLERNKSTRGGGLDYTSGKTSLNQVNISSNSAHLQGGGIWTGSALGFSMLGSTISSNQSPKGRDCLGLVLLAGPGNVVGDKDGCNIKDPYLNNYQVTPVNQVLPSSKN